MKFKAIIFDLNGVILWDRKWHEEAWNELSLKIRKKPLSRIESERYVHGKTPGETILYLLNKKAMSKNQISKLLEEKESLYQEIALSSPGFKLSPGAEKLFKLLADNDIRQTIATSSPLIHIKFYYKYLDLEKWFPVDKIIYNNGTFPGKPAPDIYLKAAKKINTSIKDCIVVEDAKSGLESAKNAGAGKIIALVHKDSSRYIKSVPYIDKFVKNLGQISINDLE